MSFSLGAMAPFYGVTAAQQPMTTALANTGVVQAQPDSLTLGASVAPAMLPYAMPLVPQPPVVTPVSAPVVSNINPALASSLSASGALTPAEQEAAAELGLPPIDENADGIIDEQEVANAMTNPGNGKRPVRLEESDATDNDSSTPLKEEEEAPASPLPSVTAPVIRGFDDSVIRNLNMRLEDPDWQRRASAANDFSMILGANPNLEKRPAYKPYVDAFMLKLLRDPSAVVHEPALRSMAVGYYRHPTQVVLNEVYALLNGSGLFGLEPQMANDALYALAKYQEEERRKRNAKH
jgi:hypothetical protein